MEKINNNDAFPFKKYYWKEDHHKIFNRLVKCDTIKEFLSKYPRFPGKKFGIMREMDVFYVEDQKYWVLEHKFPKHYFKYNVLSDLYAEDVRLTAKLFRQNYSPIEYFEREGRYKIPKNLSPEEKREFIYSKVKEASQFKPTLAKFIYEHFKATKILDPCAGWGDRLLAALSLDIEYIGFDPNVKLQPKYGDMIHDFAMPDKRDKFQIYNHPFEDSTQILKDHYNTFDMCLCSPPYFNFEKYSDENDQSMHKFPTENQWLKGFAYKLVDIVSDSLKMNGIFALHLCDNRDFRLTKPVVEYIKKCNFSFKGCIFSKENNASVKPIWIFKKE